MAIQSLEKMNEKDVDWSVYSCAQNLSAILNDPNRGKQVRNYLEVNMPKINLRAELICDW